MKRILGAFIIICFCNAAMAQLKNTQWTGTIVTNDGSTLHVLSIFTTDSSFFYNTDDNTLLETSFFKVHDSTLSLTKISGQTNCGQETGTYKFAVKNNNLTLSVLKDDCSDRSVALNKVVFLRKQKK